MMHPDIHYVLPNQLHGPLPDGMQVLEISTRLAFLNAWQDSRTNYVNPAYLDPAMTDAFWNELTSPGSGYRLAIPEIIIEDDDGKPMIQFINGRHRFLMLAEKGEAVVPALVVSDDFKKILRKSFVSLPSAETIARLGLSTVPVGVTRDDSASRLSDPYLDNHPNEIPGECMRYSVKQWAESHPLDLRNWITQHLPRLFENLAGVRPERFDEVTQEAMVERIAATYTQTGQLPPDRRLSQMLRSVMLDIRLGRDPRAQHDARRDL